MRPLVVQIAVGSLRACYLANFAPAVLLIESHVIDQGTRIFGLVSCFSFSLPLCRSRSSQNCAFGIRIICFGQDLYC